MTILELPQGYYTDLTGIKRHQALAIFAIDQKNFEHKYPHLAPVSPCWHEYEVEDTKTAPWGYEWYTIDAAGVLKRHSAHYDSSC
jgi:hypothetical protein